jgi:DNA-binding transcriptional regulator YiaG
MTVGYSYDMVKKNSAASAKSAGVKLGRFCIKNDISAAKVAKSFKVSTQTVYNWFTGKSNPHPWFEEKIEDFLAKHDK